MVEINIHGDDVIVAPQGLHVLLSFRHRIRFPLAAITSVRHDPEASKGFWKGMRLPGTHLPGVVIAGSYYKGGSWTFYDVLRAQNTVVLELTGQRYDRIVVEVERPERTVALLDAARGAAQPA